MTMLVIYRGLPASGKTTSARQWVSEQTDKRVRVNRDDIRQMTHNGLFIKGVTEDLIIKFRNDLIRTALKSGKNVVSDDTNLPQRTVRDLIKLAKQCGASYYVIDLTFTELDTCLDRNAGRTDKEPIPEEVIKDMWVRYVYNKPYPLPVPDEQEPEITSKYVPDLALPKAVIFDIDGTVAHMNGRGPHDMTKVHEDLPDSHMQELWHLYRSEGYRVIFLSGRTSDVRAATTEWLDKHITGGAIVALIMRPSGDNRRDSIVKLELFDKYVRPYYNVRCVFDDRNQVVSMWRDLGLKCFQVADGNF